MIKLLRALTEYLAMADAQAAWHEQAVRPTVHDPPICECEHPLQVMFSEQVGLWLCDCGGFIVREDCAGDAK